MDRLPDARATAADVPVVDMHCHLSTPAVEEFLGRHPGRLAALRAMDEAQGPESVVASGAMLAAIAPRLGGLDARLRDMDAAGIAMQVLSPSPTQYHYWADEELATRIVAMQNERLARACAEHRGRFAALGTVALQHPALAVAQLDEALGGHGLVGVEISTHVDGVSIADRRYAEFWAACAQLGALVFIHPLGTTLGTRLARHYLWNVIGQPLETTIALSELILAGTFDRHPDLRVLACHGGGFLGAYWGRLDHAWQVRPECRTCALVPSSYLRQVHVDTVVHDPVQLRALLDAHGVGRVLAGTDYPFDMGVDLAAMLAAVPGLTEAERYAVCRGNAERLLGARAPVAAEAAR